MKKNIIVSSLTIATLAGVLLSATPALAVDNADTNGDVNFKTSKDRPNILKPGTKDEIITPENKISDASQSNVWLSHAPTFNFGVQNINTSKDTEYEVKNITYTKDKNTTDNFEIPQFLQVADNSGKKGTSWSVTAYQKEAFKGGTGAAASTLTNSRIRFYGQTLTNNLRDTQAAVDKTIIGFTKDSAVDYATLPVGSSNAITLMSSKASELDAETTSGTVSSLVFKDSYDQTDYGKTPFTGTVTDRANNDGVKLNVPYADTPQELAYTATINWTIAATPKP